MSVSAEPELIDEHVRYDRAGGWHTVAVVRPRVLDPGALLADGPEWVPAGRVRYVIDGLFAAHPDPRRPDRIVVPGLGELTRDPPAGAARPTQVDRLTGGDG